MRQHHDDFFVVGGTMRPQAASYIHRPADDALLERLLMGEFCYVLTARQMGKSSLMVRTVRRLAESSVRSVVIDLTAIGTVGVDAWYLGLLSALRSQLRLPVEPATWWAERSGQSAPQRFRAFLCDVTLAQIDAPVVIFIDEIDSTLALPFRDDFFAALRAMFNEREAEPLFQRLTFALLGVAAPTDLIKDQARTPFNIGRRVDLGELSLTDAAPIRAALDQVFPGHGDQILGRVFHWTNGHPYLTQKLCASAVRQQTTEWNDDVVDALVARDVLDERAGDENLKFVQNRVRGAPKDERRAMLRLYQRVYRGKRVADDNRSIVQNRLELTGLVANSGETLHVRNKIYQRAFDGRWISAMLPPDNQRRVAIGAMLIAALLVVLLLIAPRFVQQPADSLAQGYFSSFQATLKAPDTKENHTRRLDSLYQLFQLNTYTSRQFAFTAFYDQLSPKQQQNMFKRADASDSTRMLRVVTEIVGTLGTDPNRADLNLIDAMIEGLNQVPNSEGAIPRLRAWREGRAEMIMGEYGLALKQFNTIPAEVINTLPAMLYDLARANTSATPPNTNDALNAINTMLGLADQQATPVPATAQPLSQQQLAQTQTTQAHAMPPFTQAPAAASPEAPAGASTTALAVPGSNAGGDDSFGPTAAPQQAAAPDALTNTRRFRTREQIRAMVITLVNEDGNLREAYRATIGTNKYPALEAVVASLPPLPSATPEPSTTPRPTINISDICVDSVCFTATPTLISPTGEPNIALSDQSPTPQPIPNITPAAGLRPAISDVVALLPTSKPGYDKRPISDIDTLVLRTSDSSPNQTGLSLMQAITDYYINVIGYPGFPYHYLVDRDGTVYQINPITLVTFHSTTYNQRGIGIGLVTFRNDTSNSRFTDAQLRSTEQLTAWLLSDLRLPLSSIKDRGDVSPQRGPTGLDYTTLRPNIQRLLDEVSTPLPPEPSPTPG